MEKKLYMPVLKWRQGEYQALFRLDNSIKTALYPLFIIPPVEFDFEEQRPKKTAEEHVEKLAKRYSDKWGSGLSLIDIDSSLHNETSSDGTSIPDYIFESLDNVKAHYLPVIKLEYELNYFNSVKKTWLKNNKGIALRIELDELADPDNIDKISELCTFFECKPCDFELIIDFKKGADYKPYEDVATLLSSLLSLIPDIDDFRAIYVIGTSLAMETVKNPGIAQDRDDWKFYKVFFRNYSSTHKQIGFGDYTVETPEFSSMDMRMMQPAAKLVYSADDSWYILKGGSFRVDASQMIGLCQLLIGSSVYCGKRYSNGDQRIFDCASKHLGTGNLSTWKEVAVSHHLALVVRQLSSFHGI